MKLFLQAAAIVLREGLEVLLVLAAVTAYLRARQFTRFLKPLYLGVGLALLATVPVVLVLNESRSLTANDGIQGLIMLAAALLMLFISGWFFTQRSGDGWNSLIRDRAKHAVASETGYVFLLISFFVVIRETAETALFIDALSIQAKGFHLEIALGILAGLGLLVVAAILLFKTNYRPPFKAAFLATSAVFFLTGLYFIGDGLEHFQLQNYVSSTPVGAGGNLLRTLGLNATWEAVAVQSSIVLAALTGLIASVAVSGRTISGR